MFVLVFCWWIFNKQFIHKNRNRKIAAYGGNKKNVSSWNVSKNNNLRWKHLFATKYICHLKVVIWVNECVCVFVCVLIRCVFFTRCCYYLCMQGLTCVHTSDNFFVAIQAKADERMWSRGLNERKHSTQTQTVTLT